jgi:hypothetical protein
MWRMSCAYFVVHLERRIPRMRTQKKKEKEAKIFNIFMRNDKLKKRHKAMHPGK